MKLYFYSRLSAAVLAAALPVCALALDTTVRTEAGQIQGVSMDGLAVFKGVPYGAPPAGNLRWRPTEPVAAWSGVRKTDEFAKACAQPVRAPDPLMRPDDGPMSEDCLYLNVWTPAKAENEKLAVIFWIHGGGLRSGATSMPHYEGTALAKKGVVVVTVGYRLGVFGFLAHPELTKEQQGCSGNYGLMDMTMALNWVKKNIARFGGDPANVTIWGQSGGATAVNNLMISPGARGLFNRAIAVSGGVSTPNNDTSLAAAEQRGVKFAEESKASSLADLRAKPLEDLRQYPGQLGVTVDGCVTKQTVLQAYRDGNQARVPVMYGSTANDNAGSAAGTTAQSYIDDARKRYGANADAYLKIFPASTDAQALDSRLAFGATNAFYGSRQGVMLQQKTAQQPGYLFYFTRVPPLPKDAKLPPGTSENFGLGAYHGAELVYTFGTLKTRNWPWTQEDFRLSDVMMSYWANFAKKGDPNGPGLPNWPVYRDGMASVMDFGPTQKAVELPRKEGIGFLEAFNAQQAERRAGQVSMAP